MDLRPPRLGLLLDVDGPIASPVTRSVSAPGLLPTLTALLAEGVPVVFNTGRSEGFLRAQVVDPLLVAGLPPRARVHAVCEKGAVHASIGPDGLGEVVVDESVRLPPTVVADLEGLARDRFADLMFVDPGKHAMVSIEQHLHLDSAEYLRRQPEYERAAAEVLRDAGLGFTWRGAAHPDEAGATDWRIDPTIISVDVESAVLGKDRGAAVALDLLAGDGPLPEEWRTAGDSRTDYAMADWLHAQGRRVTHVDVRPADGVLERPFRVLTPGRTVNDVAGAAWLRSVLAVVRGEVDDDAGFDAGFDAGSDLG
ncbi:hypothetical protein ACFFKU_03430 [Kineococcus gynurae]|uniref:Hydroxymethylpyrimidine pyrophosphatase-like HAD family hydrolase n=1 Tax=Kineococcus gynurae TaxID=452979 RepID=A0ABV5LRX8_9ACTN